MEKEGAARSICAMVDETKSVFIQININSNILTINLILINSLYLDIGR
jgi:hypothetical protein